MPRTVEEPKIHYTIRLKPSLKRKIKEEAKKYNITEISIFTKGVEMYLKYLEEND